MAKLLSGKVGVTSYSGLSTSRNQIVGGDPVFIGLSEVEPNLGLSPQNDYVLYGDANGARRWGEPSGSPSGTVSGITVRDEGIQPVGLAGSITIIDVVGDGIVAIQTHITQGGVQVGLATLTVVRNDLDGQNGSGFVQVSGISTIRVGTGLTIFAPSGTTGIASIGTLTDFSIDAYDDRSYLSVTGVSQLQAGIGLSVSSPQANRAKLDVTGNFPRLNVSGISTLTQVGSTDLNATGIITATGGFVGNVTGNLTGNVTGNVTGNLTGNSAGEHTGNVQAGLVTATGSFVGNINAAGVSTAAQLKGTTFNYTGFGTALGFISNSNSFMGNVNSGGISTVKYLQNTNVNTTGVTTSASFVGPLTGSVTGNISGDVVSTGSNNFAQVLVSGVTTSVGGFVGGLTGAVIGNVTGNLTGNSAGDHTGKVTGHINSIGVSSISQLISSTVNASGIITASSFSGSMDASQLTGTLPNINGSNLTHVSAATVEVTATNTTNATHYVMFADSVSGQENMRSDNTFTYNPNSNTVSATNFNGSLKGTATGLNGTPNITVGSLTAGNILPAAHNTYDIGSDANRYANVYSMDLQLSNKGKVNDVDGTWGDWTLQEGDENIFMINNLTGKKYKINLTEV